MKKHSVSVSTALMLCLLAVVATFNVTFFASTEYYNKRLGSLDELEERYGKLKSVADIVDKYFVGEYEESDAIEGAVYGYVAGLGDPWSSYYTAEETKLIEEDENNAYVGIGVTYSSEPTSMFQITAVTADGPADQAGVQIGDIITAVDGTDVLTLANTDDLGNLVRGEKGTAVSLTVSRAGELKTFEIIRDMIHTRSVSFRMMDGDIGYITIADFDADVEKEFSVALDTLLEQGARGMIFDVRNNPGGFLNVMRDMLDRLLPEGVVITTVDKLGNETSYSSDADCIEMPMAVLTNEYSISAAEFFAASLQEYEAAVVVGAPTSGKGYSQQSFRLSDGSTVHISTTRYYTPKGNSLAETGVTPDRPVAVEIEELQALLSGKLAVEDDTQLQEALSYLTERTQNEPAEAEIPSA